MKALLMLVSVPIIAIGFFWMMRILAIAVFTAESKLKGIKGR